MYDQYLVMLRILVGDDGDEDDGGWWGGGLWSIGR